MAAKLMQGKFSQVRKFLRDHEEMDSNQIDHLIDNASNLRITYIEVQTPEGENYRLPFDLVYIDLKSIRVAKK